PAESTTCLDGNEPLVSAPAQHSQACARICGVDNRGCACGYLLKGEPAENWAPVDSQRRRRGDGARRYRTTSRVTSSKNLSALSSASTSGRRRTAECVRASTVVDRIKAARSRSSTSISLRCASR